MKRNGRQRREKGEICERPVAPREAPSQKLLSVRDHMKRGTMDEGGWTDEPTQSRRTAAEGQPPTKKRKRCYNKEGRVVFLRPGVLDGWEGAESSATALVVVGKQMGRPLVAGGSPRYVIARPLAAGGPQEEWHISQLETSGERLPGLSTEPSLRPRSRSGKSCEA